MPAIYHEGSWLGNATDPEVLVRDTVGWTGKNRAYSQTNNAVIAHIENGTTYDVSWTGSATVTLKKNSTSGATITSGSTSPLSFTADADYELYFGSSATVTNIMVKDSRITDPTYEPYHESVEEEIEQIYADNGALGAKNLLPYTRDSSTYTQSGVTYTRNADGSINANGTATANSFLPIAERLEHPINNLKKGVEYILSGDYGMGSGNGYVYANFYNGSTRLSGVNTGGNGSVKFKIPESINGTVVDDIDFGIGVLNGKTVNNFTFYPMLRLASDPDDTYVPYAMTNRELTDKIKTIVSEAVTEAFSAHQTKWHDNANDCNVGFERTNDSRTSNMPTTGTSTWYDIMTVRESNVSTSSSFGYGFQIAVQTTSNSTMGDTYVRAVNGGATPTWSKWKKLN